MVAHKRSFSLWILAVLLLLLPRAARAEGAASPFDDPRLVAWSKLFLSGKKAETITAVEADLKSASPHPLAPHVWVAAQQSLGQLKDAWSRVSDPTLKRALGVLPDVYLRYNADDYAWLMEKYPAAKAAEIHDPTTLELLYLAATEEDRIQDAYAFASAYARTCPNMFDPVWGLIYCAESDNRVWSLLSARVAPGGDLAGTRVGRVLRIRLQCRPVSSQVGIAVAKAWLAEIPNDADAQAFLGNQLKPIAQFDRAAACYEQAERLYPFQITAFPSWESYAEALLGLGKTAEAQRLIARSAALDAKDGVEAERLAAFRTAVADMAAGEKGAARRALEAGVKRYPDDPRLLNKFAELELASNPTRAPFALDYARKAAQAEPQNEAYQRRWIEALTKSGDAARAYAAFEEVRKRFSRPSRALYYQGSGLLSTLKRPEDRVRLCEEALRQYPDSAWMLREYADALDGAGRPQEALERLQASLTLATNNDWAITKLRALLGKIDGGAKTEQVMAETRSRYPWVKPLWQDAVTHSKGDSEAKLALWRQAIALNPQAYWPWSDAADQLVNANQLDQAYRLATEGLQALRQAGSPLAAMPGTDRAWCVYRKMRIGTATQAEMRQALQDLDDFRDGNGYLAYYHEQRARILLALNREKEAWQSALKSCQLRPDDPDYLLYLFNGDYKDNATGVFGQVARYVYRDPYDGERLNAASKYHTLYGGSPILGYLLAQQCKTNDPDKYDNSLAADALGHLGAVEESFTVQYYRQQYGISVSDRYIGWFDAARRKAQEGGSIVRIDPQTGIATIVHPDGIVEKRKDNPISARAELIQVGQAYIACEYGPEGENLQRIHASSGAEIRLTYDAHNRIKTLTTDKGEELSFEYNAHDKPSRIAAKGLGVIQVTYRPDGEIANVTSSAGRAIAVKVTDSFQKLLDLLKPFEDRSSSELPELPFEDPKLAKLESAEEEAGIRYETKSTSANRLALLHARLAAARYLVAHVGDKRGYADQARESLASLFKAASQIKDDSAVAVQAGEAIGLWHDLMLQTRSFGLDSEDWTLWTTMRKWLEGQLDAPGAGKDALFRVSRAIDASKEKLELLPNAQWLPGSYLDVDGYWRRIDLAGLAPAALAGKLIPTTALIRRNHHELIGTTTGLLIWQGYWRWLAVEEDAQKLSGDVPITRLNASSNVNALAEDAAGALWIATANGLDRVTGDTYAEITRWTAGPQGLPVPGVEHLATSGSRLFLGTQRGLWIFSDNRFTRVPDLPEEAVEFLRGPDDPASDQEPVLVGLRTGVYALAGSHVVRLSAEPAEDALWLKEQARVFLVRNGEVFSLAWDGSGSPGEARAVQGQQNVRKASKVFGLARLPIDKEVDGIAVLTDLGLSIYYDEHFEYKKVPLTDTIADVRAMSGRDGRALLVSAQSVFALDRGRVMGDHDGHVYDILPADDLGLTFIARGLSLQVVRQEKPEAGVETFDRIAATHLARLPDGRIVANDDDRIVAYDRGTTHARELFVALSKQEKNAPAGGVTGLLVASDGTLWVTAGASVFRYKDGKTEEFSIYIDPVKFPSRSDTISRIWETVDGRILVVASAEGFRSYQGMQLDGGLLQWTGSGFQRLDVDPNGKDKSWFITGYTPIDKQTAIVSTPGSFARERDGRILTYRVLQDATYQKVEERMPMVWLGTKGARLGKDLWLFGCAGGIVAYRDGQWFYPDRLNWMLPDQHLSQYGARTVHAIATDSKGRVYAGTDRGLLIYDSGGGDAAAFMITNDRADIAYAALEQSKLERETEILLQSLKPGSDLARRAEQLLQVRGEIDSLKDRLNTGMAARLAGPNDNPGKGGAPALSEEEGRRLREALDQKTKAQTQMLLELQRENRSLYQMLEFKPLDLRSVRDRLAEGQVIVQYLPTREKLFIQVVTRETTELKEVQVSSEELLGRARAAAQTLALLGGRGTEAVPSGKGKVSADLTAELAWLYDRLLRPVEANIQGSKHIFIVPVDALTYLPFAALVRATRPAVEYAVQQYVFGYLPSLYHFDLMTEAKAPSSRDALIIGNPDGSLPGAQIEAGDVKTILGGSLAPLLGGDATYDNFLKYCQQARYLHLATHGFLDDARPERSYLLLANGYRLNVVDICTMQTQLAETDLAVLSACQTGLGREGMEYATLARAFATAKVPTVLATLWCINDAKSPLLIKKFYNNVLAGDDRLTALARAQREMIAGDQQFRPPSVWSGFILFGKP